MINATRPTVLIIEDHDSVRIAMSRFLRAGGFDVLEAANPEGAKVIWAERLNSISLLLVDVALNANASSGPELVQDLLSDRPDVPVIFATAGDDAQSRRATQNFANPTILRKPFSAEVLVKAVRDALEQPSILSGFTTYFKKPGAKAGR